MQKVKDLMAKKDAIEKEIKEFQDVLDSVSFIYKQLDVFIEINDYRSNLKTVFFQQKGVGMHEKLIDDENYPRSDIDVYAVRVARNRIICKKVNIMCQITWSYIFWRQQYVNFFYSI